MIAELRPICRFPLIRHLRRPSAPRLTIAFAVPGDLATVTGGYFYDRRLIESLRAMGHDVRVVTLSDGFPDPGARRCGRRWNSWYRLSPEWPVIIDGLAFGALPTAEVARIAAPIVALVHHPLAAETGLDPAEAARLRGAGAGQSAPCAAYSGAKSAYAGDPDGGIRGGGGTHHGAVAGDRPGIVCGRGGFGRAEDAAAADPVGRYSASAQGA